MGKVLYRDIRSIDAAVIRKVGGMPQYLEKYMRVDYGDGVTESLGPPVAAMRKVFAEDMLANRPSPLETVLSFEANIGSPYDRPLDGSTYDLEHEYPVSGTCVICNNVMHKEIDQYLFRHSVAKTAQRYNLPVAVLEQHQARHMAVVYGRAALYTLAHQPRPEVVAAFKSLSYIDDGAFRTKADELYYPAKLPKPVKVPNKSYGVLRAWTKERTMNELAVREKEAIDFYDEMIKCKDEFQTIYDQAMAYESSDGRREFAAASSAVKGKHAILVDLAKMSIIAARISAAPGNEGMQLSAEMEGMVSNILGKDYRARLQALPESTAERIDDIDDAVDAPSAATYEVLDQERL